MSDSASYVDDLEAVGDLARLIGQRLTPLYQLAPDVMPGLLPIELRWACRSAVAEVR